MNSLDKFLEDKNFVNKTLSSSNPDSMSLGELLALEPGGREWFEKIRLSMFSYTGGSLMVKNKVSNMYDTVSPNNVLLLSGVSEAMSCFMRSLLNDGDHIIIQTPGFKNLFILSEQIGCNVTEWFGDSEDNWSLDLSFLEKNMTRDTKAIFINFPNNPTGQSVSESKINDIIEICRKNDVYVFSDEIYSHLEFCSRGKLPGMVDLYEKGVSVNSLSKSFGLSGIRLGWLVTKDIGLLKKIALDKYLIGYSNSPLSEFLALIALKNKDFILGRNLTTIKSNYQILTKFLEKHSDMFTYSPVSQGCIVFVRIVKGIDARLFYDGFFKETGISISNGINYHFAENYFRLGFGKRGFPKLLDCLDNYIQGKGYGKE